MQTLLLVLVLLLGLGVGFLSGLLGIGGGILMTPLLLYVPPAVHAGALDMKAVAGLTMVQGLSASLSGVLVHRKFKFVSKELVTCMGTSIGLASLVGALFSKHTSEATLRGLFAAMALVAAVMMLVPKRESREDATAEATRFNKPLAVVIAAVIGFLGGMVGQGGAFIVIPMMLYVLKVPTRVTVGSSLGIVFFSALAGFVGKWATAQIPWLLALALVAGVVPGAQVGGYLSKRTPTKALRGILAAFITITAIRMAMEVVTAHVG